MNIRTTEPGPNSPEATPIYIQQHRAIDRTSAHHGSI